MAPVLRSDSANSGEKGADASGETKLAVPRCEVRLPCYLHRSRDHGGCGGVVVRDYCGGDEDDDDDDIMMIC